MATVHCRPKLVANYFCREEKAELLFGYLSLITRKKRDETLCLIAFYKMLDDMGKS